MKRLALLIALVAGCMGSNGALRFAIDPETGVCTPLPASTVFDGWQSCSDPCAGLDEHACGVDTRCQIVQRDGTNSCHAVPQPIDPCAPLDATACRADRRCALSASGSSCALEPCSEITDGDACNARPDCSTTPPRIAPTPVASGAPQPASPPATCFALVGCGLDEHDCGKRHECDEFFDVHGYFTGCAPLSVSCRMDSECAVGQRCNDAGACVFVGCAGEDERECNADPQCDPVYTLDCSPYTNGQPVPDSFCGSSGGGGAGGCGGGDGGGVMCEPIFSACQPASPGVVAGKSVLVRDPTILDDPFWALPRVLAAITGADANTVVDGWLAQLGTSQLVNGHVSTERPGAA
ncbi:MAG TPA: hypothetical protein VGL86_22795, partial [Polyangia bacterium]